ncbi:DUF2000 domain-containing protein [Nakamurella endophytica]|uniref:DUF2000 domain-containing protein n=1 Tax=Nakamurella endophytica TaxID=1748367 RepID=A0A917T6A5_9ACTN|nr:DUF2000 domain-containing protein [Nakamurella endophytica]GGM11270.1 hypothetical protein GCM10011594_34050 [Nakamurella endophytica]
MDTDGTATVVGFHPAEIDPSAPTRSARLKWVVVVDAGLPAGRAVNAAVCAAAATAAAVPGLLGAAATDADGQRHPGLPWAGCTVLAADAETIHRVRSRAAADSGMFVADMPDAAQRTRVYADYVRTVGDTVSADLRYAAVSVVGPRNRLDRIVGRLPLLP